MGKFSTVIFSPQNRPAKILIVCALQNEAKAIASILPQCRILREEPLKIFRSMTPKFEIDLIYTGMGPVMAPQSLKRHLAKYVYSQIIMTGYCGALNASLKCGTGLYMTHVVMQGLPTLELQTPELWKTQAQAAQLLTVAQPLISPEEKKQAALDFGADSVDMESYPMLEFLQQSQLPSYSIVRFVLDELEWRLLSADNIINPTGKLQNSQIIKHLIQKPSEILRLPHLAKAEKIARTRMANFFK